MKYSSKSYARAFSELAHDADVNREKELWANLASLIRKNGDIAKADAILEEALHELVRSRGGRYIKIETARPLAEALRREVRQGFKKDDLIKETVTPSLVAGMRVTVNGEQELDESLQRKLNKLFVA